MVGISTILVFLVGCSTPPDPPTASPGLAPDGPTASPSPAGPGAAELFAKGKAKVKSLRTAHASVVANVSGVDQNWVFDVDLKSGSFRGTIDAKSGVDNALSLKIIRTQGFTWMMAPEEYWVSAGYTAEGAAKARGKYVVFEVTEGNSLAKRFSVADIIKATERIQDRNVSVVPDDSDSAKVTFVASPGTQSELRMTFRRSDSQLMEVRSDVNGVNTVLKISKHNEPLDVKFPSPGEVVQP
jgi:hypothetical protein